MQGCYKSKSILLGASLAAAVALAAPSSAGTTLELMHFWTSGGESNAMQVIKDAAEKAGITWRDAAVAGGAGMNAYQVLQARIAAGNPPAAMQMHSAQIRQFSKEGLLGNVDDIAAKQGWEAVLDPQLVAYAKSPFRKFMKYYKAF